MAYIHRDTQARTHTHTHTHTQYTLPNLPTHAHAHSGAPSNHTHTHTHTHTNTGSPFPATLIALWHTTLRWHARCTGSAPPDMHLADNSNGGTESCGPTEPGSPLFDVEQLEPGILALAQGLEPGQHSGAASRRLALLAGGARPGSTQEAAVRWAGIGFRGLGWLG